MTVVGGENMNRHVEAHTVCRARGTTAINETHRDSRGKIDDVDAGNLERICLLQTGYFKAKQAFFRFSLNDVPPEDIAFLLQRYFPGQTQTMQPLLAKEYYAQRKEIAALFDYRLWSDEDLPTLLNQATLLAKADVTPAFLLTELMAVLIGQRIVRPGYTTLQTIIRDALSAERQRLEQLIEEALDRSEEHIGPKYIVSYTDFGNALLARALESRPGARP